ncbi:hypothetical protein QBC45DRAFT_333045, partial [Copromyces sp. CBS 386.78]
QTGIGKAKKKETNKKVILIAPAANRTRGPSMATMDFTTKPLALFELDCCTPGPAEELMYLLPL